MADNVCPTTGDPDIEGVPIVAKGIVVATDEVALDVLVVATYPGLVAVMLTVMVLLRSERETL